MAFTPCCQNFVITIDPRDCAGDPSKIDDLVWALTFSADLGTSPVFNATGGSGSVSEALTVGLGAFASASDIWSANLCNNTRSNFTVRATFNWNISGSAGGAGPSQAFYSIALNPGARFVAANTAFPPGSFVDNSSTFLDTVVPACSTVTFGIIFQYGASCFPPGPPNTSAVNGGFTFSLVKL